MIVIVWFVESSDNVASLKALLNETRLVCYLRYDNSVKLLFSAETLFGNADILTLDKFSDLA